MSLDDLLFIQKKCENMKKYTHVEILKILYKYKDDIILNENQYGIHVNLSELEENVVKEIKEYILFLDFQQEKLSTVEKEKTILLNNLNNN